MKFNSEDVSLISKAGVRKYLTEKERHGFLQAANQFDTDTKLLCQVLVFTGCRLSEALQLKPINVDVGNLALTFETLKQRRRGVFRQVPIPKSLLLELVKISDASPFSNARYWPMHRQSAWRLLSAVFQAAGINGVHATSRGLRHGFGVAAIQQDIPLTMIKKWLGHARLETTAIYLDAVGAQEREFAKRIW